MKIRNSTLIRSVNNFNFVFTQFLTFKEIIIAFSHQARSPVSFKKITQRSHIQQEESPLKASIEIHCMGKQRADFSAANLFHFLQRNKIKKSNTQQKHAGNHRKTLTKKRTNVLFSLSTLENYITQHVKTKQKWRWILIIWNQKF